MGKFESWSPAQYITGLPEESLTEMKLDTEGALSLEVYCDDTICSLYTSDAADEQLTLLSRWPWRLTTIYTFMSST